jgi:hypothetical protein
VTDDITQESDTDTDGFRVLWVEVSMNFGEAHKDNGGHGRHAAYDFYKKHRPNSSLALAPPNADGVPDLQIQILRRVCGAVHPRRLGICSYGL